MGSITFPEKGTRFFGHFYFARGSSPVPVSNVLLRHIKIVLLCHTETKSSPANEDVVPVVACLRRK